MRIELIDLLAHSYHHQISLTRLRAKKKKKTEIFLYFCDFLNGFGAELSFLMRQKF